jgi:Mrp family chromosome partitioning ATPase
MSGFKCPRRDTGIDLFKTSGGEKAAKDFEVPFLGKIPLDVELASSGD